jgi:putative membrane protein
LNGEAYQKMHCAVMGDNNHPKVWSVGLLIYVAVFIWSAWEPYSRVVWGLEVAPAVIALLLLVFTRSFFPLTSLSYSLILLYCLLLMVGAHFSFSRVPWFVTLSESMGWSRIYFDKLVHLGQGFVPALVVREFVIRRQLISGYYWQWFFVVAFCLAVSAGYELIEWWLALVLGLEANIFLATQGDPWDTQSDMLMALLGAMLAMVTLSRYQDKQLTSC